MLCVTYHGYAVTSFKPANFLAALVF